MGAVAFGRFTLIDQRGDSLGEVIIAPEYILLQRGPDAPVRDVSYLALWSAARVKAVAGELATLATLGSTIVDATTPELRAILHAIAPTAAPLCVAAGRCRGSFARAKLKAELARSGTRQPRVASPRY